MAIVFELWAECRTPEDGQRFADHVATFSHTLSCGRTIAWAPYGPPCNTDANVFFGATNGLSDWGIRTLQDALDVTEVALRTYHHLLASPPFRYARIDWEAWTCSMDDLPGRIEAWKNGERRLDLSCVLDEELWRDLGSPVNLAPFRAGYVWSPYPGETYRPLGSADHPELRRLEEQLFPERK